MIAVLMATVCQVATAQSSLSAHDARSSGMGGCFMPDRDRGYVRVAYRQAYGLNELADKYIAAAVAVGKVGLASASYMHHGNLDYHRQQAVVGYGMQLSQWLQGGAKVGVGHIGTASLDYEPQWNAVAEVYASVAIGNKVSLTLLGGTHPEQLQPSGRWVAQVAYTLPQVVVAVEGELTDRPRVRMGMEYHYREVLFVRAGVATAPVVATCGVGVRFGRWCFDLAVEEHAVLGFSPHTSLTLWL